MINHVEIYHELDLFNIVPLKGKRPLQSWKHAKEGPVQFEGFGNATGIGAISYKGVFPIDFDGVQNFSIVKAFCEYLRIDSTKYQWLVRSGSHKGFHVWINGEIWASSATQDIASYQSKSEYKSYFDHLELRFKGNTVLPPSLHESGNRYEFINGHPMYKRPAVITRDALIEAVKRFCIIKPLVKKPPKLEYNQDTDINGLLSRFDVLGWIQANAIHLTPIVQEGREYRCGVHGRGTILVDLNKRVWNMPQTWGANTVGGSWPQLIFWVQSNYTDHKPYGEDWKRVINHMCEFMGEEKYYKSCQIV